MEILDEKKYNIITNKNMLPNDDEKPNKTSGLRIGFAALTTRGCTKEMAITLAYIIYNILKNASEDYNEEYKKEINKIICKLKQIETL